MSDHPETSQSKQKAIWYYFVNGKRNGPLTSTSLIQLYRTGMIKKSTPIWKQGLSDWKPISQFINSSTTSGRATAVNPVNVNTSLKGPILTIAIAVVLIVVIIFGYFQFLIQTPLDGGWQGKNILGITNGIMLFDGKNCWYCDTDNRPRSANYQAVKDGENSYKVTLSKDNRSMILLISFVNNDTINISMPGSTSVETMTRINKTMAKNMMGIS